jgi:ABC-type glycerol-3-phosphate transport system substrate-binding protein
MAGSVGGFFETTVGAGVSGIASCDRTMKISLGVTGGGSAQTQEIDIVGFDSQSQTIAYEGATVVNPPTANSKGLRIGNFPQIRDVVDEELESVWSGKKDAKAALDEAVKRGNELLRKFDAANK